MKTRLLSAFALIGLVFSLEGQTGTIPNSSLETWTSVLGIYEEPNGWSTSNQYKGLDFNNPVTVFKTTDAYSGTYAAKLETKGMVTAPDPGYDTLAFLIAGSVDFNTGALNGFPYAQRPERLEFYHKYIPVGADESSFYFELTKWDTATDSRVVVGSGGGYPIAVNTYTPNVAFVTYNTTDIPDSAFVIFLSSSLMVPPQVGSQLFVDDVTFQGLAPTSVATNSNPVSIKAFPNPATTTVTFSVPENTIRIVASHINGQTTKSINVVNGKAELDIREMAAGIYFYSIFTDAGKQPFVGKFVVTK